MIPKPDFRRFFRKCCSRDRRFAYSISTFEDENLYPMRYGEQSILRLICTELYDILSVINSITDRFASVNKKCYFQMNNA